MQGHRDLELVGALVMEELTRWVAAQYGAFYLAEETPEGTELRIVGSYGRPAGGNGHDRFKMGESLVGQAARSRRTIAPTAYPVTHISISSGLGPMTPGSLIVLPVVVDDQVLGVIELASFTAFTPIHRDFLEQLMEMVGVNVKHHRRQRPHRRTPRRVAAPHR
ncbi:GAF domain-containing protein [Streptomyces flavovirens]|uniref:GAF domain-containing protein n=1 Tax=Streptomyces flavovirens TaxID=52258 RepID=UPI003387DA4B